MPITDRRQPLRGTLPALQVRGLNLYYGHSHALQGVDLTLQDGVLSLVGRNGMGKTSLCKSISITTKTLLLLCNIKMFKTSSNECYCRHLSQLPKY